MTNRLRACLFDLDGTLIDSIPLILACYRHTFTVHFGKVPPDDVWVSGIGTPLLGQLRGIVGDDALARRMADTYRDYQDEHHNQLLKEFPGVRETLTTLRAAGHPIGVVTSKMRAPAERGLRHTGLFDLVDVVVDAESTTKHKPDPTPVLLALEKLSCAAARAVFVGDAPVDIQAGRAAGTKTIATFGGPFPRARLEQEHPDAIMPDVNGVPAWLAGH